MYSQNSLISLRSDTLFIGVGNPIWLDKYIKGMNIQITSDVGVITKYDSSHWDLMICKTDSLKATLTISERKNGEDIILEIRSLQILETPSSKVQVYFNNGNRHGYYNAEKPKGVRYLIDNFNYDMRFTIKEFKLTILKLNGDSLTFRNYGANFSKKIRNQLCSLKSGDKFYGWNVIYFNECEKNYRMCKRIETVEIR